MPNPLDDLRAVKTINLAPTPTGYAMTLIMLLENGGETRQFAVDEIVRLIKAAATITPDAWGKEDE